MSQLESIKISDYIAFFALVVSAISFIYSLHNDRERAKREEEIRKQNLDREDRIRDAGLEREDTFREEVAENNRASLLPYFQLDLSSEIKEREEDDEIYVDFPIRLVNVGHSTAVNVRYELFKEGRRVTVKGFEDFFRVEGLPASVSVDHLPREVIQPVWAKPGDAVKLITTCRKHGNAAEVYFQLSFEDLMGRRYVQKFMFTYCLPNYMGFSLKYRSDKPELQSHK